MKYAVVPALVSVTLMSACGTREKKSATPAPASKTVIARVALSGEIDGSAVGVVSTAQDASKLNDPATVQTSYAMGTTINPTEPGKVDETAPVLPVDPNYVGPNNFGPNQGKDPTYFPVVNQPYTPQTPVQNGYVQGNDCGCGWRFPIVGGVARTALDLGRLILAWRPMIHANNTYVNNQQPYGPAVVVPEKGKEVIVPTEPAYVPIQTPVQNPYPGDSYMKDLKPTYTEGGKDVKYDYSHQVDANGFRYYIYRQ